MRRLEREAAEQKTRSERERRDALLKLAADFEIGVGTVVDAVSSAATEMESSASALSATAEQARAIRLYRGYNAAFQDMNDFWHRWLPRLIWLLSPVYVLLLIPFFPKRPIAEHPLHRHRPGGGCGGGDRPIWSCGR